MAARINKATMPIGFASHVRKPNERKEPKYLDDLRQCPCCICGKPSEAVHHLMRVDADSRGMGLKNADRDALPLCTPHHDAQFPDAVHRAFPGGEEAWLAHHGIDGRALTKTLYAARDDVNDMIRIVENTIQRAKLRRASNG